MWPATSYLVGLVAVMWPATHFVPLYLQQPRLERESRERKRRFEVRKLFNLVILVYFGS